MLNMNFKLLRNTVAEDNGLLIQPNLPWLGASPDGKVLDQHEVLSQGLLEIRKSSTQRGTVIYTNWFKLMTFILV